MGTESKGLCGHVMFEIILRHLCGDIKQAVEYMAPEFKGTIKVGDKDLEVCSIEAFIRQQVAH